MPLETGTTIEDLDDTWPLGTDFVQEGDDHLRLIKAVLKLQFPGSGGDGFGKAITATEDEINYLSGLTSNVQDQINSIKDDDSLIAPSGTVMLFYQVAPPTGWTQMLSNGNSMLHLVSTAGGSGGGIHNPIEFDYTHSHTGGDHSLTVDELPEHSHQQNGKNVRGAEGGDNGNNFVFGDNGLGGSENPGSSNPSGYDTYEAGSGAPHSHGETSSNLMQFRPKYINVIAATKD